MQILPFGIAAGLAAAFFSAVSYLVSRHYGNKDGGSSLRLLVFAHVLMGIVCLPIAWFLRPDPVPLAAVWLPPLVGSSVTYLLGQAAVFAALKRIDASQLAPLLGLKIAVLAVLATCVRGEQLTGPQWLAVIISVAAVAVLQWPRRHAAIKAPWATIGMVMTICLCFAIADLFIVALIDGVQLSGEATSAKAAVGGRLRAGGFAMAATYVLCGMIAMPLVHYAAGGRRRGLFPAALYAAAWLASMAGLYVCFGLVGAVLGNILQSTRGVMAVGLGAMLASMGWHDLEQPVDRETFVRRIMAAVLMTVAIAIYAIPM